MPEFCLEPCCAGSRYHETETQSPDRLPQRASRQWRCKRRNLGSSVPPVNRKLQENTTLRDWPGPGPGFGVPRRNPLPGRRLGPGQPGVPASRQRGTGRGAHDLRPRPIGRDWSGKRDSNPRPSAWKADALPLSYSRSNRYRTTRWWRGEDSNLRRLRRQIYSLLPLTAREPLRGTGV